MILWRTDARGKTICHPTLPGGETKNAWVDRENRTGGPDPSGKSQVAIGFSLGILVVEIPPEAFGPLAGTIASHDRIILIQAWIRKSEFWESIKLNELTEYIHERPLSIDGA